MRQVPKTQLPDYLVIGNGRVARHFLHYFSLLGIDTAHWHRGLPLDELGDAQHILVLISDDAIEDFIRDNLADKNGTKIHFSGSLVTELAVGAHPLMTFGTTFGQGLYAREKYEEIFFILDDDAPDFNRLLPGLPNPYARLAPARKAQYHAHCVMAANYSCLLWQKLFDAFENDFSLPPEAAFPLLKQQTENLVADRKNALTGPLARGDSATIARNLSALAGDDYQKIYQVFVETYQNQNQGAAAQNRKEKASC